MILSKRDLTDRSPTKERAAAAHKEEIKKSRDEELLEKICEKLDLMASKPPPTVHIAKPDAPSVTVNHQPVRKWQFDLIKAKDGITTTRIIATAIE